MSKQQYRETQRLKPIGKDGIEQCRAIVRESQFRKINEVMVDGWTASTIVQVYDAINETNRAKLEALPVYRVASMCLSLANKAA